MTMLFFSSSACDLDDLHVGTNDEKSDTPR